RDGLPAAWVAAGAIPARAVAVVALACRARGPVPVIVLVAGGHGRVGRARGGVGRAVPAVVRVLAGMLSAVARVSGGARPRVGWVPRPAARPGVLVSRRLPPG